MDDHAFLAGPYPRAFVHRGWHCEDLEGLENALTAFRRAYDEGYRYLETDVHATSDGVVVVHHDPELDRTTDSTGLVADLPWKVVRRAKIGGREPVSRLEELLEELPNAFFNIDVKDDSAIAPFVDTIRRSNAFGRVCAASFSAARLTQMQRYAGGNLLTSMGKSSIARLWLTARLPSFLPARRGRPIFAQVPVRNGRVTVVDRAFVDAAHRRGIEVHVWTIDDPAQMHELIDLGVDGLMTDQPHVLREVLQSRGLWSPS